MRCSTDLQAKVEREWIGFTVHESHAFAKWMISYSYIQSIQLLTFSCIRPQEASPLKNSPGIAFFFSPVEMAENLMITLKRVLLSSVWMTDGGGSSSLLHVTLQQEHDGRVALRRLLELLQWDLVVVVLIHFAEDLVHPLLRCQAILVHLHHDHGTHHFVDRLWARWRERRDGYFFFALKLHLWQQINSPLIHTRRDAVTYECMEN